MSALLEKISCLKAYRKNRLVAASWVLAHPESFKELLQYCFKNDSDISHKANWTLEFVLLEDLHLLFPHLNYFFKNLSSVKGDSSLRPLAHICELLILQLYKKENTTLISLFSEGYKQQLTECCFDWMITNQKVACQAYAMTCLYYLGTETDWIHPELKTILQENMHRQSAGYRARGRKILQQIKNS